MRSVDYLHYVIYVKLLPMLPASKLDAPISKYTRSGGNQLLFSPEVYVDVDYVIDFGAYTGEFLRGVRNHTDAHLIGLEPIPAWFERCSQSLSSDMESTLFNCMLGEMAGSQVLRVQGDLSGAWAEGEQCDVAVLHPGQVFEQFKICEGGGVALINIEGGEYTLIPLLARTGLLTKFRTIFVQFHRVGSSEASGLSRGNARRTLSATHRQIWSFDWVWERWDLKLQPPTASRNAS